MGMMLGLCGNCHAILLGMTFSNCVYFSKFIMRAREFLPERLDVNLGLYIPALVHRYCLS